MQKAISLCALLSFSLFSFGQQLTRCYSTETVHQFDQAHPGYKANAEALFDAVKSKSNNRAANDTVYKIRVVFHVVYTNATENIPDSYLTSQIEVLNEDYRRKNADTNVTRTIFQPVAADTKIEFELATEDPFGNPTNGITRTAGNPGFLGYTPFTDNVKSTSGGGKDPWPTDKYLNIWVCNVFNGFGILGYAFPPSTAPNWPANSATDSTKQGVVLHYPIVGRVNTTPLDPTVAKGRSAVHEIGHYLGLRHIWGDGGCAEDDGFADTPADTAASQQTCDYNENSCVDAPTDFPDQIENYMDYSDDRCLNMFSREQADLMRNMLTTARPGIISSRSVEFALGIQEAKASNYFSIYPNPTIDRLTIELKQSNQAFSYALYDLAGKEVMASTLGVLNGKTSISTASLGAGAYLLKVKAAGQTYTQKVQVIK